MFKKFIFINLKYNTFLSLYIIKLLLKYFKKWTKIVGQKSDKGNQKTSVFKNKPKEWYLFLLKIGIITVKDKKAKTNVKWKNKALNGNEITEHKRWYQKESHRRHDHSQRIWHKSCTKKQLKNLKEN